MRSQIELHEACSVRGCSRHYGAGGAVEEIQRVPVLAQRRVDDDAIVAWVCGNVVGDQDFLCVQNTRKRQCVVTAERKTKIDAVA